MFSSRIKIVYYILAGVILFILFGLGWWYFFLRAQQGELRATDRARGAGTEIPSFESGAGSTYGNLVTNSGFGGIIANLSSPSNEANATNTPTVLPRLWQVTKT